MNGLLAAMAVANPVITALLTIIVFLEKDKLRKRTEDIEAALKNGSASVVQAIEAQKTQFTNIADKLEALSKDSEKSAAAFICISNALTESSAVSAKALSGVTEGLQAHSTSVAALVTELSKHVSSISSSAIEALSMKTAEALKIVSEEVSKVEAAQAAGSKATTDAVLKLTEEVSQSSKSIKELEQTLKSTVTL